MARNYLKRAPLTAKSDASETHKIVKDILDDIEAGGDAKAMEYAAKFDQYDGNVLLTQAEIDKAEEDKRYKLKLKHNAAAVGEEKRRGPRYTPLSKRQDRPASILWLVKFHPELSDGQISKLVGTTKPTINAIRDRTHWNIQNIQPIDPVALGLCKQSELDAAVQKANAKKAKEGAVMSDDERRKLVSTEQSLGAPEEPALPTAIAGLEAFTLADAPEEEEAEDDNLLVDADSLFNLPESDDQPDVEEDR